MKKRAKKKTPEQEVQVLCKNIRQEIAHWKYLNENGCNDPFWADGVNMNLTRNHIIYDKRQIEEISSQFTLTLPDEYYLPTPPEVPDNYMANLQQRERVKRIRQHGKELTVKRNKYDEGQLSLF